MNRDIKFRGFHEDENGTETIVVNGKEYVGTWIYGYLYIIKMNNKEFCEIINGEMFEIINDLGITGHLPILHEVIPETVSQFTGLQDKNGKDLFENDFFRLKEKDQQCLVEWYDTGFMAREYWKHKDKFCSTNSWLGLLGYCKGYIEIIGTKFDKDGLNG